MPCPLPTPLPLGPPQEASDRLAAVNADLTGQLEQLAASRQQLREELDGLRPGTARPAARLAEESADAEAGESPAARAIGGGGGRGEGSVPM